MLHSLTVDLTKTLDEFHKSSYQELHDKMACAALGQMKQSSQNASDYVTSWTNAFTQEHGSYSSVSDKSEETVFSEMYKSLIHSSALETLLQLENTYALAMDDAVTKKESAIKTMEEKYVLKPFHSCFLAITGKALAKQHTKFLFYGHGRIQNFVGGKIKGRHTLYQV